MGAARQTRMEENLQVAILTGIYTSLTCLLWYLFSPSCIP